MPSTPMGRTMWRAWDEDGRPEPTAAAKEEVRCILAERDPEPLPEDMAKEPGSIVDAFEYEAQAKGD